MLLKLEQLGIILSTTGYALCQVITTESPTIIPSTTTTSTITSTTTSTSTVNTNNGDALVNIPYWGIAVAGLVCMGAGYLIGRYCCHKRETLALDLHEDIPTTTAPPPSPALEDGTWAERVGTRPNPVPYDTQRVRQWLNSFDEENTMETQM
jgi:hypothetical protein